MIPDGERAGGAAGQSLVELLVAIFVLALITGAILVLVVLTGQTLFNSSRHASGQALLNEHLEFIRSLTYDDIGFRSGGVFPGVVEPEELREVRGTTYRRRTFLRCESGTPAQRCLKRIEVLVDWTDQGGERRVVRGITLAAPQLQLFDCNACPGGTACHAALGICLPGVAPAAAGGTACSPGLLCTEDGSLCPADGVCRGAEAAYYEPPEALVSGGDGCVPGQLCPNGALCPYNGSCPTQACPAGSCPAGQACFNSFCYDPQWLYDFGLSVSESSEYQCLAAGCATSLDCPQPCAVDGGTLSLVYQCEEAWVPACRAGEGGGAAAACRGTLAEDGSCDTAQCQPVACPAGGACANGQRCDVTSSNLGCSEDSECESGEMCDAVSRRCRTICADDAACTPYWGGAAKSCRPYVVSGVSAATLSSCPAEVVPAALPPLALGIAGPGFDEGLPGIGVAEGDAGTTELVYRLTLSGLPNNARLAEDVQVGLIIRDSSGQAINAADAAGGSFDYDAPVLHTFDQNTAADVNGQIAQDVLIEIVGDNNPEANETFTVAVRLARSMGYSVDVPANQVAVTILNDD